jgi:hypothetical protein
VWEDQDRATEMSERDNRTSRPDRRGPKIDSTAPHRTLRGRVATFCVALDAPVSLVVATGLMRLKPRLYGGESQRRSEPVRVVPMLDMIQSFNGSHASKVSTTNCRRAAPSRNRVAVNLRCALTAFCRSRSTRG